MAKDDAELTTPAFRHDDKWEWLGGNQLTVLPDEIGQPTSLRDLVPAPTGSPRCLPRSASSLASGN